MMETVRLAKNCPQLKAVPKANILKLVCLSDDPQ